MLFVILPVVGTTIHHAILLCLLFNVPIAVAKWAFLAQHDQSTLYRPLALAEYFDSVLTAPAFHRDARDFPALLVLDHLAGDTAFDF
jgi:hypothetical protein